MPEIYKCFAIFYKYISYELYCTFHAYDEDNVFLNILLKTIHHDIMHISTVFKISKFLYDKLRAIKTENVEICPIIKGHRG